MEGRFGLVWVSVHFRVEYNEEADEQAVNGLC